MVRTQDFQKQRQALPVPQEEEGDEEGPRSGWILVEAGVPGRMWPLASRLFCTEAWPDPGSDVKDMAGAWGRGLSLALKFLKDIDTLKSQPEPQFKHSSGSRGHGLGSHRWPEPGTFDQPHVRRTATDISCFV